jgi:NCS2 family nucleobase:cation symporter-2
MMRVSVTEYRKPANLIYGVEDKPARWPLIALGFQHAALLISCLVASVFFAQEIGAGTSQTEALVNVGLIAGGIACILQSLPRWGIGAGYFCLHTSSFIYFHASVLAAKAGGLALVFGMTVFAGILEIGLSRIFARLRPLFPPEVAGLVVAMVGVAMTPYALKSMLGLGAGVPDIHHYGIIVGTGTFGLIIGLNIWGRGALKLYSILIGICFGYLMSYTTGILSQEQLRELELIPLIALPHLEYTGFAFSGEFVFPFAIAAVCASLKLTGDIITCQKINDTQWIRVDMASVKRGLNAEGIGTVVAGLMGGTGLAASSSNIGMSLATGATSRSIGYVTGMFFIALAFFPRLASLLSNMPKPVVGAIVLYAACFMIVTGWSIIMTRLLDTRKTVVIGISFILGMSVGMIPELYSGIPQGLKPIFGSSIALTAVTAVLLNLLFRIGVSSRANLVLEAGLNAQHAIQDFFEVNGATWGARRDVIMRAASVTCELYENLAGVINVEGAIRIEAVFDEYSLLVLAEYQGAEICLSATRPTQEELFADDDAFARLAGYLISQMSDSVSQKSSNGCCQITLTFDQ